MLPALRAILIGFLILSATASTAQQADKPAAPTGRWRGDLVDPVKKDTIMKVALSAPARMPDRRRLTLLLLHHGYQGNEGNYIGLTVEALKRLKLEDEFVVISGKSKGPGWTTEDDERVLRVIAWARDNYPIDPRRVFLFGSSNGAAYVGRFGSEHADLLAGVIGYCGNYKFNAEKMKADNPADTRTEWYFVHGGKDNPQNSRKACDFLKERGHRYVFRQMDGYGHTDIWDSRGHADSKAADAVRDDWLMWVRWLRHKEIPPSVAEKKQLAGIVQGLQSKAPVDNLVAELNALDVGGREAGEALLPALTSADTKLRRAAAAVCTRTQCGNEALGTLIKLLDDPTTDMALPACFDAVGTAANWRHPEAQAALIAQASDKKKAAAVRAQAVARLGIAVTLGLLGNFEDKAMMWTLVGLLDDGEAPVREAAFAALEKGVPDTFSYKSDLPEAERKTAMEKWRAWCKEKCGPAPDR